MSGYGSCKWTCGECGESYEASGVVGDFKVDRWEEKHRDKHRWEKMSFAEKNEELNRKTEALTHSMRFWQEISAAEKKKETP